VNQLNGVPVKVTVPGRPVIVPVVLLMVPCKVDGRPAQQPPPLAWLLALEELEANEELEEDDEHDEHGLLKV